MGPGAASSSGEQAAVTSADPSTGPGAGNSAQESDTHSSHTAPMSSVVDPPSRAPVQVSTEGGVPMGQLQHMPASTSMAPPGAHVHPAASGVLPSAAAGSGPYMLPNTVPVMQAVPQSYHQLQMIQQQQQAAAMQQQVCMCITPLSL